MFLKVDLPKKGQPGEPNHEQLRLQELIPVSTAEPYQRNHPKQKAFDKSLQAFIVMDTQPFSVTHGLGFQYMIHRLDEKLALPRRTTVERRTKKAFQDVKNREYFQILYAFQCI